MGKTIGTLPANHLENTTELTTSYQRPKAVAAEAVIRFKFQPENVAYTLLYIVGFLTVAHLVSLYLMYRAPNFLLTNQIIRLFELSNDSNVPTLFSSFLLLTAAGLLFLLARLAKSKNNQYEQNRWVALSLVFVFLTIDEGAMVHDVLSEAIKNRFAERIPDFLWSVWVVPYLVLAVVLGSYFIKFLWKLPATTRNLFLISGFFYVLAAAGFEIFETILFVDANPDRIWKGVKPTSVHVLETIEEIFEMVSIVLFIFALLRHIKLTLLDTSGKEQTPTKDPDTISAVIVR